ncbi:MAG: hypothetical protein NUW37_06860 [Planctomycetes bacterium]|nr:hypothetical protein [Planctomycetota bacterium]
MHPEFRKQIPVAVLLGISCLLCAFWAVCNLEGVPPVKVANPIFPGVAALVDAVFLFLFLGTTKDRKTLIMTRGVLATAVLIAFSRVYAHNIYFSGAIVFTILTIFFSYFYSPRLVIRFYVMALVPLFLMGTDVLNFAGTENWSYEWRLEKFASAETKKSLPDGPAIDLGGSPYRFIDTRESRTLTALHPSGGEMTFRGYKLTDIMSAEEITGFEDEIELLRECARLIETGFEREEEFASTSHSERRIEDDYFLKFRLLYPRKLSGGAALNQPVYASLYEFTRVRCYSLKGGTIYLFEFTMLSDQEKLLERHIDEILERAEF